MTFFTMPLTQGLSGSSTVLCIRPKPNVRRMTRCLRGRPMPLPVCLIEVYRS
jgi:hypothetical protein